ncbi:MAG: hypothetical protein ABIG98_01230 [Chloroflexota bacterium]
MKDTIMARELKMRIAGVTVRFVSESVLLEISDAHPRFLVDDGQADILIRVHYGQLPTLALEEKLFDTGSFWTLHRSQGKYVFSFTSPVFGPLPYSLAILKEDFTQGDLYFRPTDDRPARSVCPVLYPFDEVLMVNYLARGGGGMDIHACGIDMGGKGLAFVGVSGAGKSTTARLWQKRQVPILSDDRLILRKEGGRFFMHGTPWHGDAWASLPGKAPLEGLYFLKQAPKNYIQSLAPGDAARRLLVRCFPPFYLASGMEFILGFIDELTQKVPSYELGFLPDDSAVETVLHHVRSK